MKLAEKIILGIALVFLIVFFSSLFISLENSRENIENNCKQLCNHINLTFNTIYLRTNGNCMCLTRNYEVKEFMVSDKSDD